MSLQCLKIQGFLRENAFENICVLYHSLKTSFVRHIFPYREGKVKLENLANKDRKGAWYGFTIS